MNWHVKNDDATDVGDQSALMAWARDRESGQAIHISELALERNGAASGCECFACKAPLVAVNAGKLVSVRRPHFRHPPGAHRADCLANTARRALVAALADSDVLVFPRRRMHAQIVGFSGEKYEAWVAVPEEALHVQSVARRDDASAIVTLQDGRQILVRLQASWPVAEDESDTHAVIEVISDDPVLATLPPEELRSRMQVLVAHGSWLRHWSDSDLLQQAHADARAAAACHDDLIDECGWTPPPGLSPREHHETILHLEAKRILAALPFLQLPDLVVEETLDDERGCFTEKRTVRWPRVPVLAASVEQRVGSLRPDLVLATTACDCWPGGEVLVEVTVTSGIDTERRARIAALGMPAIELKLNMIAGRLTRSRFRQLLIEEVAAKAWICPPPMSEVRRELQALLSERAANAAQMVITEDQAPSPQNPAPSGHSATISSIPRSEHAAYAKRLIATHAGDIQHPQELERLQRRIEAADSYGRPRRYDIKATAAARLAFLDALREYLIRRRGLDPTNLATLGAQVATAGALLASLGFSAARNEDLWLKPDGVLERMLALCSNDARVTRHRSLDDLVASMCRGDETHAPWHPTYFAAIDFLGPSVSAAIKSRFRDRPGLRNVVGDRGYELTRLVMLLFPTVPISHRPISSGPQRQRY